MYRFLLALPLLVATLAVAQEPHLNADAIMARVAANQDKSESARTHYLYTQHAHIASRKGKTIYCEETTDTRITPSANGSDQQLLKLDGRLLQKSRYVTYTHLPTPRDEARPAKKADADKSGASPAATDKDDEINVTIDNDQTMDRDLVENLRKNLTATHSKDGISANLFPLSSKEQVNYTFSLLGREARNGRDSFHIGFVPKDPEDVTWKGDAWIDATAFQPIVIRTTLSRKLPLAVRMLLGTNVPGLGFTIVYAPQSGLSPAPAETVTALSPHPEAADAVAGAEVRVSDGRSLPDGMHSLAGEGPATPDPIWFPTSFGTEFKIHVFFFFHREIVFNADNRDFHLTHTSATIRDAPASSP